MENEKKDDKKDVTPLIDQTKAKDNNERHFNLIVDEIPYRVEFEPFFVNAQVRYNVRINAGTKDVFVWDSGLMRFRAIDDKSGVVPVALEIAISEKLENQDLNSNSNLNA